MDDLSERLIRGLQALNLLEAKRNENAITPEDYEKENRILMTELRDLEEDIVNDPGALQAQLVPVRRRREGVDPR